jgi:hypothetical protein
MNRPLFAAVAALALAAEGLLLCAAAVAAVPLFADLAVSAGRAAPLAAFGAAVLWTAGAGAAALFTACCVTDARRALRGLRRSG